MTIDGGIRVVVCDHQDLFRRGLVKALDDTGDIEVVAEAVSATDSVNQAVETVPDVVLLDVAVPESGGVVAAVEILARLPTTRVLFLSVSQDDDRLLEGVRSGVVGYVLKDTPLDDIAAAVRAVAAGHSFISPRIAASMISEFAQLARRVGDGSGPNRPTAPGLTTRELDVLRLLADGNGNDEIASALGVTANSVKNQIRNILEKLHVHTRTEAVMYAMRERLVDP